MATEETTGVGNRRSQDADDDDDCVTAGLDSDVSTVAEASTCVAFVEMPTSVLEIAELENAAADIDDKDEDTDDLPFPEYVEKAFFYFLQTTRPRSWCLQLITWPYPFCVLQRACTVCLKT